MNNNPSPGNKAGGLTTILEKSLGAVAKGGTSNLEAVYEYAEPVTQHGLVYMDTPGYDPVSATGQVAGGANLICFPAGRGSPYGCAPSPSLKLATNSALWQRQQEDMDINCGEIIDGQTTIAAMGQRIFEQVLATASGAQTKSEQHGYGQTGSLPWRVGAVMEPAASLFNHPQEKQHHEAAPTLDRGTGRHTRAGRRAPWRWRCRHQGAQDRAVEKFRRQLMAPGHAQELGQGGQECRRPGAAGAGPELYHLGEPGDRAGRANPEPDPARVRRHRDQRGLADGAQRRGQTSLRRGHRGGVVRRHRQRALRLAHRGRLQAVGPDADRLLRQPRA